MFWIKLIVPIILQAVATLIWLGRWREPLQHRFQWLTNYRLDRMIYALYIFSWLIIVIVGVQGEFENRRLKREVAAVRDVAMRDEYRALSPELRRILASELRVVQNRFKDMPLQIFVMPRGAGQIRQKIAADLTAILSEAMFNVTLPEDSSFDSLRVLPDVQITTAPAHRQLTDALMPIFSRFINTQFSVNLNEGNLGRLWVFINGDPLFMPDGVVAFR
jgi:hypothetical protein